jgi:hypothetical protein
MISKITNVEKEGGHPEYGYDIEGRLILVKKPINKNSITQG